jgi:hypothetical protein
LKERAGTAFSDVSKAVSSGENYIAVHSLDELVWEETFNGKYVIRPNKILMGKYKIYRVLHSVGSTAQDMIHSAANAFHR